MVAWLQVINRALGQDLWASPGTYSPWSPPWGPRFCSSFAAPALLPALESARENEEKRPIFRGKQPNYFQIASDNVLSYPCTERWNFQHLFIPTRIRMKHNWKSIWETISLRTILHIRSTISTPRTQLLNFRIDRQLSSHQSTSTHERSKFFGTERCIIRLSHRIVSYRWEEESAARRTPIPLL